MPGQEGVLQLGQDRVLVARARPRPAAGRPGSGPRRCGELPPSPGWTPTRSPGAGRASPVVNSWVEPTLPTAPLRQRGPTHRPGARPAGVPAVSGRGWRADRRPVPARPGALGPPVASIYGARGVLARGDGRRTAPPGVHSRGLRRLRLGADRRSRSLALDPGVRRPPTGRCCTGGDSRRRYPAPDRRAVADPRGRLLRRRRLARRQLRRGHRGLLLPAHLRDHRRPPRARSEHVLAVEVGCSRAGRPHREAQPHRGLPALGLPRPGVEPGRDLAAGVPSPRRDRCGCRSLRVSVRRGDAGASGPVDPGRARRGRSHRDRPPGARSPGHRTPRWSPGTRWPAGTTGSASRSRSNGHRSGGPTPSAISPSTTCGSRSCSPTMGRSSSRPSARSRTSRRPGGTDVASRDGEVSPEEIAGHVTSDSRTVRTGLRQVRMNDFIVSVNGERLFVKGSNQGPTRMALAEATPAELERDVVLAREAGPRSAPAPRPHHPARALRRRRPARDAAVAGPPAAVGLRPQRAQAGGAPGPRGRVDLLSHHPSIAVWCGHNEPLALADEPGITPRAAVRLAVASRQELPTWNKTILDGSVGRALERADPTRPVVAAFGRLAQPGVGRHRHAPLPRLVSRDERDLPRLLRRRPAAGPVRHRVRSPGRARRAPTGCEPERWPDLDWDELGTAPRPATGRVRPLRATRATTPASTDGGRRRRRTSRRSSARPHRDAPAAQVPAGRRVLPLLLRRRSPGASRGRCWTTNAGPRPGYAALVGRVRPGDRGRRPAERRPTCRASRSAWTSTS